MPLKTCRSGGSSLKDEPRDDGALVGDLTTVCPQDGMINSRRLLLILYQLSLNYQESECVMKTH